MFKTLLVRNIITSLPHGRCLATITEHVSTIIMVEIVLNVGDSILNYNLDIRPSRRPLNPVQKHTLLRTF